MKIFGLNILTNKQLDNIKSECNYKWLLNYFKIKKLYKITCDYVEQPKCNKCNDKREYETILPDGRKIITECLCKQPKIVYRYVEVNKNYYNVILHKFDKKVYLMEDIDYYHDDYKLYTLDALNNVTNPKYGCLYTEESKAKKAIKMLNKKGK